MLSEWMGIFGKQLSFYALHIKANGRSYLRASYYQVGYKTAFLKITKEKGDKNHLAFLFPINSTNLHPS